MSNKRWERLREKFAAEQASPTPCPMFTLPEVEMLFERIAELEAQPAEVPPINALAYAMVIMHDHADEIAERNKQRAGDLRAVARWVDRVLLALANQGVGT